ncbi:hypothetical protein KAH94_03765 [bacterium]|nr:hypothetical protein [bacterium]
MTSKQQKEWEKRTNRRAKVGEEVIGNEKVRVLGSLKNAINKGGQIDGRRWFADGKDKKNGKVNDNYMNRKYKVVKGKVTRVK